MWMVAGEAACVLGRLRLGTVWWRCGELLPLTPVALTCTAVRACQAIGCTCGSYSRVSNCLDACGLMLGYYFLFRPRRCQRGGRQAAGGGRCGAAGGCGASWRAGGRQHQQVIPMLVSLAAAAAQQ